MILRIVDLPEPFVTDDADRLTFFNRKGKIAQRVEILVVFFMADAQRFFQPVDRFIIQPVYLGHIFSLRPRTSLRSPPLVPLCLLYFQQTYIFFVPPVPLFS